MSCLCRLCAFRPSARPGTMCVYCKAVAVQGCLAHTETPTPLGRSCRILPVRASHKASQGHLAHGKQRPPRTLQYEYP